MGKGEVGVIFFTLLLLATLAFLNIKQYDNREQVENLGGQQFMIFSDPPEASIVQTNYTSERENEIGKTNTKVLTVQDFLSPGEKPEKNWSFNVKVIKEGFKPANIVVSQAEIQNGYWPEQSEPVISLKAESVGAFLAYVAAYRPLAGTMLGLSLGGLLVSLFLAHGERKRRQVLLKYEADPTKDPFVGTFFQNHFVTGKVGKGATGTVYTALDEKTMDENKPRALKIVNYEDYLVNEDLKSLFDQARKRFMREMELLATTDHPNIYQIFDFGREDTYDWVIMPFYDKSLDQLLEDRPLEPERILSIAKQLAAGLLYTHEQGVAHRDLKPDNIMLVGEQLKLIDFGLAKIRDKKTITEMNAIMGTPKYMAPEQASGVAGGNIAAIDQFSYGLILFKMVSGHHAYDDPDDPMMTIMTRLSNSPRSLTEVAPEHSKKLEEVLSKMMSMEPSDRYRNVMVAYEAFEEAFKESVSSA